MASKARFEDILSGLDPEELAVLASSMGLRIVFPRKPGRIRIARARTGKTLYWAADSDEVELFLYAYALGMKAGVLRMEAKMKSLFKPLSRRDSYGPPDGFWQ
jgi:hypothetical protein